MSASRMRMMHFVEPPPVVGGGEPQRHADEERDRDRQRAEQQNRARAVGDARPHVAAQVIGAQEVLRGRSLVQRLVVLVLARIVAA